jgi:branched-chain amino acid transport system substrate-binding protein
MSKKVFITLGVIAVIVIGVIVWLNKGDKKQETVKIGVILPLTGERSSVGISAKNGINLAVEEINANAYLGDTTISLFVEDSKGLPASSLSSFEKLATINNVPAIVGPLGSSEVLSIAPKAEQRKVVILTPGASSPLITDAGDYIFRNVASDLYEATLMADAVIDNFQKNRIAIVYINNDYGKGVYEKFSEGLAKKEQRLVAAESYEEGKTDFRTIILKIKETKPDAIYIVGYQEIAYFIKQIKEQGVNSLLLTTAIFEDPEIIRIAGNSAEGIIFTTFYLDEDSKEQRTRDFFQNYERKYNVKPDGYAATSYDAAYLIAQVIKNKSVLSESIKNGLYEIKDFPGLLGNFSIDKNGDVTLPIKMKTIKDGQLVNYSFDK